MEQQPGLSDRELEIIHFLIKGLTAKEIADSLNISECTVKTHLKNIREKLDAKNAAEIVAIYYQLRNSV